MFIPPHRQKKLGDPARTAGWAFSPSGKDGGLNPIICTDSFIFNIQISIIIISAPKINVFFQITIFLEKNIFFLKE
jgi:hypothetical protein